ncbi:response regulator [Ramlibacter sp.]|uniref:ATP-binding response regulator n=1 Tax=Ramlibacter sp. TaxID=1917967 RepID=UPI0018073F69|nr:response regulator [Ramlibacter sp.]MBA2673314.1 response regulator [Ramlibacter sp.]
MIDTDVIHTTIDRAAHTVLVVDDNAATRYATARLARAAGFATQEAASGGEAMEMSVSGVSAVVLDVHLPDIDGFEVCRRMRARVETSLLPIIHLSATYIRPQDRVTGLNAGADAYLVHPVEPAVLVATLQALIRARSAEDALRRSELRFRAIYDQADSGIGLLDAQGCFADANPALQRLLRRPAHELLGQPVRAFAAPEQAAFVDQLLSGAQNGADGAPVRSVFPLLRPDGSPVHLEWSVSSHAEPGLRIAVAIDVSQRHELEERRRDVLEREQAARSVAERHSRTKDDFIAVLSHELRTPLNAIMGWVHVLKRRGATPETMRGLDAIERNVKTQARIISDILDVSRINSGKLRLDCEPVDPGELIADSLASVADEAAEKRVGIRTDVVQAQGTAWLDPARFQQIFWNLMTNAIKFSPPGGEVEVLLRREGERLDLTVRDHGVGIAPEFLGHMFDRFAQSDAPGNRAHGGLGLGLAIVKHLAELHGGSVVAMSGGLGTGTTMRVELPVQGPVAEPAHAPRAREDTERASSDTALHGLDVLLVEDDADATEMMVVVLADRGARVRCASSFDTAVEAMRAAWPDVLVSDIGLPGRDGYELARQARLMQPPGRPGRLPAIALTAFTRPEDREKAEQAGFDLHLSKPLQPQKLVNAIEALVGARRTAGQGPA